MSSISGTNPMEQLKPLAEAIAQQLIACNPPQLIKPIATYGWHLAALRPSRDAYKSFVIALDAGHNNGYQRLTASLDAIDLLTLEDYIALYVYDLAADEVDAS
jgi:hypothetical protein